jgi:transcriptional regulator with XRE-family HTH domain
MARNQLSDFDRKIRKEISENLKKYTSHMTQGELSRLTGIPASTLSGYFAMRSTPNAGTIQKIADALKLEKSDLDPRFATTQKEFTPRVERDIQKRLQSILDDLNSDACLAFYNGGEEMDDETKDLLRLSLETSIRTAKRLSQEKFTPKKYRKNDTNP